MEREIHPFGIHRRYEAAYGLYHYHDIACLDGDDDIEEVVGDGYAQKLHGALYHSGGGVAIAAHDAVAEASVVHTDTDCGVVGTARVEKRYKSVLYAAQFSGVFCVGIFELAECASRIYEIAGVDTHLVDSSFG